MKIKWLFIFLFVFIFFSLMKSSMAIDDKFQPCESKNIIGDFKDIEELNKNLAWHGAKNDQILKSPCKNLDSISSVEIENYLKNMSLSSNDKISKSINGVNFDSESPIMLEAFKNLTTSMDLFGKGEQPKDQKNFQQIFQINSVCKKVICSVKKIWGEKLGPKILYTILKHNYNPSEYAFANSDRFTIEEMDDVLMGIADLPKHLSPLGKKNQRLTHFKRGYTMKSYDSSVVANAVIMLFDPWNSESKYERQYSIFHEMSHNVSSKLDHLDESPEFLSLSGWVNKGGEWTSDPSSCFISKYGLTNPAEDFAESLSTYRYNAKFLKENCPSKYNFIKERVFDNNEYLSVETCSEIPKDLLNKAAEHFSEEIGEKLDSLANHPVQLNSALQKNLLNYPVTDNDLMNLYKDNIYNHINNLSDEQFSSQLANSGVKVDRNNLSQFKSGVVEILSRNLVDSNSASVTKIKLATENYYNHLILENIPELNGDELNNFKLSKSFNYDFDKNCREVVWSGDQLARRKCATEMIIKDDLLWSTFSDSNYFNKINIPSHLDSHSKENLTKKYYQKIEEALLNSKILDKDIQVLVTSIKRAVNGSIQAQNHKLAYDKSKWKKMETQEFCLKYFNNFSSYELKYILPKNTTTFPGFIKWCSDKQSLKKKRAAFSDSEILEYLNSAIL